MSSADDGAAAAAATPEAGDANERGGEAPRRTSISSAYKNAIEPSRPLPEGWVAFLDAGTQKEYYYHHATKETLWEHPDDLGWFSKVPSLTHSHTPSENII